MKAINEIKQLRAEMLLNYFYPELEEQWITDNKGSFYRNYNRDILAMYEDECRVELSRDNFLKLLPETLLSMESDLKSGDKKAKVEEIERRRHLLNEAFLPIDTFRFRRQMQAERQVAEMVNGKLEYLLKTYFGFDLQAETNPYVRQLAVMLPFVKQWRGDFGMLRNLLAALFSCEVEMTQGRYSHSDSTRQWLPLVNYDLLIGGLEAAAYRDLRASLQPVADFISEWFMPMEVVCRLRIKEHHQPQRVNTRLVLNYNTENHTTI